MQNILREADRAEKVARGGDGALADAWIGHTLIAPARGKASIESPCSATSLAGATLRSTVTDTDFDKPGRRAIAPAATSGHAQHDTVHALNIGTATHDDWRAVVKSRRAFSEVPRPRPRNATRRVDLADVLSGAPVDAAEAARNRRRWAEDVEEQGMQRLPVPGADHPSSGATPALFMT